MNPAPQFNQGDEFEWEQTLRQSDAYAARYFELLRRFSDLPDADALIAKHLGDEFRDGPGQCDFDCENCSQQWNCELAADWELDETATGQEFLDQIFEGGEDDEDECSNRELLPGDALFYETHPAFQMLQHCAFGWCNIYAAVLSPDGRKTGLHILYYLGRSLAHIASSVGDGIYDNPDASVAFAKRSLAQVNMALGEMQRLSTEQSQHKKLMSAMRQHLLKARCAVFDQLEYCRRRGNKRET